jgi:hypothetical protein
MRYRLLHPVELAMPWVPLDLEGLRIAHLTDLHVQRSRRRFQRLMTELQATPVDMAVMTGDYMDQRGHEAATVKVLDGLARSIRARHGVFGVFGNHDTEGLIKRAAGLRIHWLQHGGHELPDVPIQLVGMGMDRAAPTDVAQTLGHLPVSNGRTKQTNGRVTMVLSHLPTLLPAAADMGAQLLFAGHTHGGQCRIPPRFALRNSTDLSLGLTCGVLRHRDTWCVVSRGIGETAIPLRVFCRPHVPVYTLRNGEAPTINHSRIVNVRPW